MPISLWLWLHCKYLNALCECNDIVISVYSHYPLDSNAKSSETKGNTFSIRWFCIRIEGVMTVYRNYDLAFRYLQCKQVAKIWSLLWRVRDKLQWRMKLITFHEFIKRLLFSLKMTFFFLGAIFILRKGVLRLFWTTHPPT